MNNRNIFEIPALLSSQQENSKYRAPYFLVCQREISKKNFCYSFTLISNMYTLIMINQSGGIKKSYFELCRSKEFFPPDIAKKFDI